MSGRFVYKTYRGRLGNQLFQWASVLGLAARHNATACFGELAGIEAESNPGTLFVGRFYGGPGCPSLRPCATAPKGHRCWRLFAEQGSNRHDELPLGSSPYTGIVPPGFLQSFRYFDAIAPLLRKRLRFKKDLQAAASEALRRLRHEQGLASTASLVGVHVRRGDKTRDVSNAPGSKTMLVLPSLGYWQHAMGWHRQGHTSKVHFVVVSDDPPLLVQAASRVSGARRDGAGGPPGGGGVCGARRLRPRHHLDRHLWVVGRLADRRNCHLLRARVQPEPSVEQGEAGWVETQERPRHGREGRARGAACRLLPTRVGRHRCAARGDLN